MKPFFALFLAASSLSFWAVAQDITLLPRQSTTSPASPVAADASGTLPDGIAMMNGVVYLVRGGKATRVEKEIIMRVTPKGSVTDFDGRVWLVPPGQLVTMDGRTVAIADSILDTRAAEQASRPSSEGARNYSGLAPAGSGVPPTSQGAASVPVTGGAQAQGTGVSGGGRDRADGGFSGGVVPVGGTLPVPLANDLNFIPNTQISPNAPASTGAQGTPNVNNQQRAVTNPNARPAGTSTGPNNTQPSGTRTGGASGGTGRTTGGASGDGTGTATGGTSR